MALLVDRHIPLERLAPEEKLGKCVVGGHRIDDELVKQIITSQSRRLDDQRTPLPTDNQEETFLNLVSQIQGARMDDQRASLHLDPIEKDPDADQVGESAQNGYMDDDEFIELLYRCQSSRINKQRSLDPKAYWRNLMPGEDFFNLLHYLQSFRIEDQRSPFPNPS